MAYGNRARTCAACGFSPTGWRHSPPLLLVRSHFTRKLCQAVKSSLALKYGGCGLARTATWRWLCRAETLRRRARRVKPTALPVQYLPADNADEIMPGRLAVKAVKHRNMTFVARRVNRAYPRYDDCSRRK